MGERALVLRECGLLHGYRCKQQGAPGLSLGFSKVSTKRRNVFRFSAALICRTQRVLQAGTLTRVADADVLRPMDSRLEEPGTEDLKN